MVLNHISTIRSEHDDFAIRFASAMNQVLLLMLTFVSDFQLRKFVNAHVGDVLIIFCLLRLLLSFVFWLCFWQILARLCHWTHQNLLILNFARRLRGTCMIWLLKDFNYWVDGLVMFGTNVHGSFHAHARMQFLQSLVRWLFLTMKRFYFSFLIFFCLTQNVLCGAFYIYVYNYGHYVR